jgi:hypothetical protein
MTTEHARRPLADTVPSWQPRLAAGVTAAFLVAFVEGAPWWTLLPLGLDLAARALDRRDWSWLGALARAVAPHVLPPSALGARSYWPPKRFASRLGLAMLGGVVITGALGAAATAVPLALLLATLCALEAAFGLCVACRLYTALGRLGLVVACPGGRCDLPARTLPAAIPSLPRR